MQSPNTADPPTRVTDITRVTQLLERQCAILGTKDQNARTGITQVNWIQYVQPWVRVRTEGPAGITLVAARRDTKVRYVAMKSMSVAVTRVSTEEHARITLRSTGVYVQKVRLRR